MIERKRLFIVRGQKVKSFNTNTLSLCSCGTFHVFNFIGTYLSLLQFAPWIVGRPHCGCWGHKGDNGSPLGLLWWKRHAAAGVLPRLQHWFYTVVLFHTGWINGRRQKDKSPFFPLFLRSFFFGGGGLLLKVQTSEGKWPLTSPFWTRLSLSLKWCEGYGKGRRSASLSV